MDEYGLCGESAYTMITFADLFDLRYSRMYRAVIFTIDRTENTAEIVIEEECPDLVGLDLSAVPFFYHCEDSTGTVEDLARGHEAFLEDDEVIVLWSPENGDIGARLFIIGHANIRTNRRCHLHEYILVYMGGSTKYATIFDVGSTGTLSLANFSNLDGDSPAKPVALPCVVSAEFEAWFSYNFKPSDPQYEVPGAGGPLSVDLGAQTISSANGSTYPSGDAEESCFYESSAHYNDFPTCQSTFRQEMFITEKDTRSAYYKTFSETCTYSGSSGTDTDGWMFVGTAGDDFSYNIYQNIESYSSAYCQSSLSVLFERTLTVEIYITILNGNERYVKSISSDARGSAGVDSSNEVWSGDWITFPEITKWTTCKLVGELGIYTLTGASLVFKRLDSLDKTLVATSDERGISAGSFCEFPYLFAGTLSPLGNTSLLESQEFVPIATVTLLEEASAIDLSEPVDLRVAMEQSNNTVANSLEASVLDLAELVLTEEGAAVARSGIYNASVFMKKKPS